jgi:hypothetical protein
VGGGTFGRRVFGHLGFAHSRRLRPGIGRLAGAGTADSFGSARDSSSERRIRAGICFDRKYSFDADVGCVFDIDFGLAKIAPSSRFIIRSDTVCFKHIGTGAEIGRSANTASKRRSAHVRGTCKNQRDTNGLHARGHRTRASRHLGNANRVGHPPRGLGKANIRDVSRHQTPLGAVCGIPHSAAHWLCNGRALRDGRKTSAEVGDTNNTASTARARRLATAGSESTAAAGKARKRAHIGRPSNVGSSFNIGSFGRIWCPDRIWTGPRAGTNISRGTDITNIGRTGVASSDRRRAFCSEHGHRHGVDIGAMGKVRHYVDREHRLRITARLIGGAVVACHAIDISDLGPARSGSRARSDRSNTLRCRV